MYNVKTLYIASEHPDYIQMSNLAGRSLPRWLYLTT